MHHQIQSYGSLRGFTNKTTYCVFTTFFSSYNTKRVNQLQRNRVQARTIEAKVDSKLRLDKICINISAPPPPHLQAPDGISY